MKKRTIKKVSLRKRREQGIRAAAFMEGIAFSAATIALHLGSMVEAMRPFRAMVGGMARRRHDTLMEAGFPSTQPVYKVGGHRVDYGLVDELGPEFVTTRHIGLTMEQMARRTAAVKMAGPEVLVPRGSGICGSGCGCFNQCELRNPKASTLPHPARVVTVLDGHKLSIHEALRLRPDLGRSC